MQVNIKQFIVFISLSLLSVLYIIFSEYYSGLRDQTASAILKNLQDDMSEISYVLSKNIQTISSLKSQRAVLERAASNNHFIENIMVFDHDHLLMTTDPSRQIIPKQNVILHGDPNTPFALLHKMDSFEGIIRFYQNGNLIKLRLVFVLDKEEVNSYLDYNKDKFFIYLVVMPAVLILLIWGLLHRFVTRPLGKLNNYLQFKADLPEKFKLKELDAIRTSMLETFSKLELEQKELYLMARRDSLTGLPNRDALDEHLAKFVTDSNNSHRPFAFLFLDLDLFKTVNDSLGHHIGDELLKNVGHLIKGALQEDEFVARVGGDEFILLLQNYEDNAQLIETIQGIQRKLSEPFYIHQHQINISSSVGVAFYPQDGQDFIGLMQCSDIAMYEAKKNGRAQHYFYTQELNTKVQKTIALEKEMQQALKHDEYVLFYQPKVDMDTQRIIGAEALIRWVKADGTLVSPNDFIPIAEENGFIVELGQWVLEEGFKQLLVWQQNGINIKLSINVAAKQFLADNFETDFHTLLNKYPINPKMLDLEITEYLFFEQNKSNYNTLNRIRDLGVTVSLDDFGTGYSSLSYLKKFPIDYLKIDKSFVDDFDSVQGAVFLETIVKMGESLKMGIIAEGVETLNQIEYLKKIGCNTFQGFFCSRPLPIEEFESFYQQNKYSFKI